LTNFVRNLIFVTNFIYKFKWHILCITILT